MLKRTCVPGYGDRQRHQEQVANSLRSQSGTVEEVEANQAKADKLNRAIGQRVQDMRRKCNS